MTSALKESIEMLDKNMHEKSLHLLGLSMEVYQIMELKHISKETREQLKHLTQNLADASNELCRLKEQIKEEHYNDIQDTEN
jgi:hypothetical protein